MFVEEQESVRSEFDLNDESSRNEKLKGKKISDTLLPP